MEELIADAREATAALEELIRNAEGDVPDTPPVPTAKQRSEDYDKGFNCGYIAHKRDVFIPMLAYAIIAGAGGFLIGMSV